MADKKITDMAVMAAGTQATDDVLAVVDISEINANNKNKKITIENLFTDIPATVRTSANSNVAIGVTPPTWSTAYKVLQAGAASLVGQAAGDGSTSNYSNNAYFDTTDNRWEYIGNDDASQITQTDGKIIFKTAASGAAGAALTWIESMRIDGSGRVGIGVTPSDFGANSKVLEIHSSSSVNSFLSLTNSTTGSNGAANGFNIIMSDNEARLFNREAGDMTFWTSGTQQMTINSSGNVGIGTGSPQTDLHVDGTWTDSYGTVSISGPANALNGIGLRSNNAFKAGVFYRDGTAGDYLDLYTSGNNPVIVTTNNLERLRVTGGGAIGIGSTVPVGYLDIGGAGTGTTGLTVRGGGSGYSTLLRYGTNEDNYISSGALGSTTFRNVENKELLKIHPTGQCVLGTVGNTAVAGGGVDLTVRMTPASSSYGVYSSNFSSGTTAAPAGYGVYGHMGGLPPSGSGQYGVYGKVDTYSTRASGGILGYSINNQVFGIVGYWSTAAYYGFYTNGSVLAAGGFTQSDSRLKDIVQHGLGTGVLDKVCALQAKKFTWKDNTLQRRGNERVQIGFIAQDLQADFPEIVNEDFNGRVTGVNPETLNEQLGTTLSVDYGKLVPILVEALKEAKDRIETLETKVTALEAG